MKLLLRDIKEHYMEIIKHFYMFDEEVDYEEYKDKYISAFFVDPEEYSLYFYPDLDDEEEEEEEEEYEEDIPYFDPYDYYDENPPVDDTTWQRALDNYEKSFDTYDL